ncbi:MAG TPA: PilW family protein [Myxococcota bacterium]|nr:PilW family protein [Myxococcota bacterium]
MRTRHASAQGFTLTELMVSVAVMAIVMMYLMGSFTTQHHTYVMMDQVSEAQQNLRAINDLIESEIRTSGFMVPEQAAVCGKDNANAPDVLLVSDAGAIDPTGQKKANLGADVVNGTPGTGSGTAIVVSNLVLDGAPAYDTDGNGVADSDFQCVTGSCTAAGRLAGGVIVVDAANAPRGAACGIIQRIQGTTIVANMLNTLGGAITNTPQLKAIPAHVYQIDAQNRLLRDNLVLANDVEDLQVAWFFDLDQDGQVDPGEYRGIGGGTAYNPAAVDGTFLREVRANVVIRTRTQDDRLSGGKFQATENRGAVAAQDGFRRRVLTTTVRLRNVGTRG